MIGDISRAEHIYIVCGYTDMRKAIDGLAAIVQQNFKLDVFSGSLFLYNVPLVKTQMKKIIVTAKTLYSHPKNVSKIYAALHTDLAW